MLILFVPSCSDQHEATIYDSLKRTEEDSLNHQSREIVASSHCRQDEAPKNHAASNVFQRRGDLEESVVNGQGDEVA